MKILGIPINGIRNKVDMGGEICFVLVYYDHEIVLEGLKQSIVVCAIVLFICGGGGGAKRDFLGN